jgi:mannosylglycerate synthase
LPSIEQPLGGEFLVTRKAAEVLFSDQRVCSQSDWGIDTLYTFVIAQNGLRMAEVYIPEGKVHSLYGGLRDLRTMLVECFSAIQSLKNEVVSGEDFGHCIEFPKPVPELLKQKVGYDIEKSLKLLKSHWTPRQQELLHQHFDSALVKGLMNACDWPCWGFADEEAWAGAYLKFLDHFEKGDTDWEELLFKVWVARVLNHTLRHVIRGYDVALGSLRDLVWDTRQRFGMKLKADAVAVHPIVISGHSAAEGLAVNGALTKSGRKKAQWLDMDNLCTV